jgi:ring-1,2-phenylacetyl-CoA epoxidase subunit PaaE
MTGSTVTGAAPVRPRPRPGFYPLTVTRVEPLTADSAAITFAVPDELAAEFAFAPGQSLTVRRGDERRSYSICAPAGASPRIGVREVAGGAVSGWLVHEVRPGDTVEVQAPGGSFTPDLSVPGHHVLLAAGSGITPMMSIAASVLAADGASTVTLVYGNRRADTVMFADEVADLKDAYPARMRIIHVLSREPQEVELYSGRLDRERLRRLLPVTVAGTAVDHWWLCGPFGMVTDALEVLDELGVDSGALHRELFWVGDDPPVAAVHEEAPPGDGAAVTVILDGRSTTLTLPPGVPVLDGAQKVRPDLPFACKGGVCGTCRARVTAGKAVMRRNYALEQAETDAGYVLTCQALPASDEITVDYDA